MKAEASITIIKVVMLSIIFIMSSIWGEIESKIMHTDEESINKIIAAKTLKIL